MAYIPSSGSVVAFQSNPSVLQAIVGLNSTNASVITVGGSGPANQSVSGLVGASIIGIPTFQTGNSSVIVLIQGSVATVGTAAANQSVSGTVGASIVGQLPAGTAMIGSVVAYQGAIPWTISSVYGNISGSVAAFVVGNSSFISVGQGSIAAVIVGGSIATATTNSSVMLLNSANVIGSVIAYQGAVPWAIAGSVAATVTNTVTVVSSIAGGLFPISGSVAAVVTNNVTVVSSISGGIFPISGSVAATIVGTPNVNTAGSVVAFQGGAPWANTNAGSIAAVIIGGSIATATTNSSVMLLNGANVIGSVTALQGTNPWIQTFSNSSILAVPVGSVVTVPQISSIIAISQGSIAAFQGGTWNVSVVGNMAGSSSVYQVLSSISTISIMAANTNRKAGTVYNTAGTTVFVKLGTAANTSVYTVLMNPNDYYELPGQWTGVVAGITNSTAGTINVTELS